MSKIEELEKELYTKSGEGEVVERMRHRTFFPGTLRKFPSSWFGREDPPEKEASKKKRSLLLTAAFFIVPFLVSIGGALFLFIYLGTQGQEAEVKVHIRDTLESGEIVTIAVALRNITSVPLQEVELVMRLPEGSLLVEGQREIAAPSRVTKKGEDLLPGEDRAVEIAVRLFGQEGEEKTIEATVLYRPEHLRARFSAQGVATTRIVKVPVSLSWEMPETLSRGQDVAATLRFHSNARLPFEDVAVRLEYPPGFTFIAADPPPTVGTAIWSVGTLDPGEEGVIVLRGKMVGEEGEIKAFRASLGKFNAATKDWRTYQESARETRIAVTPLSVQLFTGERREGLIAPGQDIRFLLRYRNNTPFLVRNLTVRVFLEGVPASQERFLGTSPVVRSASAENVLEFSTLRILHGGVFEGASRSLVWGPGGTPALRELAPGEGGALEFEVRTRARPTIRQAADKNFVVRALAEVNAAGIPPELAGTALRSEDMVEFKIKTKVFLEARAVYRSSPLTNSGPLPPQVGKTTKYTIVWEVKNFSNDVRNAEVSTLLPPNINWENVVFPRDARMSFDLASGEVRWNIGEIKAGTGVVVPSLVGAFQVSITPAEVDKGDTLTLTQESRFTGEDVFTEEKIEERVKELSTRLEADPLTESREWVVAP